ncbi:ABC transporter permease, partial [Aquiflexum sp.]|uniref:ABC transporter permease n=1 Tax=Aquiflexum sp. TaxID=1872584 RepID=UPI003594209A
MIKNNVKIAMRSLLKQKVYTFINILGLAVGVASCVLIVLFIQNEFSYDKFFQDQDRIYRMSLERIYPNHSTYYAIIPHSFAGVALDSFDEIEAATIASRNTNVELTYINQREEEVRFDEEMILAADSSFFKVFDFEILKGKTENLLALGSEMAVTEEFAKRYFGDEDPIGKLIRIGENLEFTVTS